MKVFEDNEIIKAVECCIGNTKCGECPMFRTPNCMNKVFGYALDLINRKDTKIAELEAEVEKLNDILPKNKDMIVILPCEIGTRIYQVIDEYDAKRNGCSRCLADFGFKTECAYYKNKDCTNLTANKHWQIISRRFELKDKDLFGEMIFLTHTEAEAKLNEINARYDRPTEKGGEGVMAELVEVTRCKDCEYWQDKNSKGTQGVCLCGEKDMNYGGEFYPFANDFCSYGTPKERGGGRSETGKEETQIL